MAFFKMDLYAKHPDIKQWWNYYSLENSGGLAKSLLQSSANAPLSKIKVTFGVSFSSLFEC